MTTDTIETLGIWDFHRPPTAGSQVSPAARDNRPEPTPRNELGIRPRNDQVFIRLRDPYAEYSGPLHVPENVEADVMGQRLGDVVAVGPGRWAKGKAERIPIARELGFDLQPGDVVVLDQIATIGAWPEIAPGVHAVPARDIHVMLERE